MLSFVGGVIVGAAAMWAVYRFKIIAEYKYALDLAKREVASLDEAYNRLALRLRAKGL